MRLDRVDLADIAEPAALALALHRQIGRLDGAVPVIDVALGLGIANVRQEVLDGCEGVLLTDRRRSHGSILVNTGRGRRAARFGIAHELGHFLIERHELGLGGAFSCTVNDMRQTYAAKRHRRQEVEANEFAGLLLAPPYATAASTAMDPGIAVAEALSTRLDLSLEAAMRCLVERHDEPLAAVWCTHGVVRYMVRGPRFPWIARDKNQRISPLSHTHAVLAKGEASKTIMRETSPAAWSDADIPELFEQVRLGRDGHSLTLLWATLPSESEDD